jgi:hypothetical protein
MAVRIYQPSKTAMQSGEGRTHEWILEYEPAGRRQIDPLMGWTSSTDTGSQVRLTFPTKEAAVDYARRHGLAYTVIEPTPRRPIRKSYAENFRYGRLGNWTH